MRIAYWTGYSPVFEPHTVVTEDWKLPGGGWGSESSLAKMAVEGHLLDMRTARFTMMANRHTPT